MKHLVFSVDKKVNDLLYEDVSTITRAVLQQQCW